MYNSVGAIVVVFLAVLSACGTDGEQATGSYNKAELARLGEEAFYDTLLGRSDRAQEAVDVLSRLVQLDADNGIAHFQLGMMHMFRFAQSVIDYHNATQFEREEILRAQRALDRAVELVPDDRRIPGFRAAATYMRGVVEKNARLQELGLEQLRAAIALYPEFNTFDFIGTVAFVVPPDSPLFAEAMQYVGDPLNAACSPFTQPTICGNAGKAPHNIEGSLVLFGDLFAKAGDLSRAQGFYRLALADFSSLGNGKPWRFRHIAEQRLATAAQRVALYKDADPNNDPPLIGHREEACAVCHYE
ncbi:hypothetical protein HRbin30_02887 [bacterium HR30]|nr:hypothetical protein HRbin30_02887 [bacterium HR30]